MGENPPFLEEDRISISDKVISDNLYEEMDATVLLLVQDSISVYHEPTPAQDVYYEKGPEVLNRSQ